MGGALSTARFRQIPQPDEQHLRYLTFGHTWLSLSSNHAHGYHDADREQGVTNGPLGNGFVLAVPTGPRRRVRPVAP